MKKQLTLSIAQPCHEKWSSFTPTSKGAFCGSCQKEVIDFTSWSDERIVRYVSNATDTCGRFKANQLKAYELNKPKQSRLQMFASVALVTVLSFFWQRPSFAQTKDKQPALTEQHLTQREVTQKEIIMGKTSMPVSFTVTGVVRDEDGGLLPGVNVGRKGTGEGTVSNQFGEFKFVLTNPGQNETLVFSFIGLVTMELPISARKDEKLSVTMQNDVKGFLTGEVIIVRNRLSPGLVWNKLKSLLKPKSKPSNLQAQPVVAATSVKAEEKDIVVEPEYRAVACYPNPVTDSLTVRLPGPTSERLISVSSLQGQVLEERISTRSEEQFDVSVLPSGIYIVRIEGGDGYKWMRVVKR